MPMATMGGTNFPLRRLLIQGRHRRTTMQTRIAVISPPRFSRRRCSSRPHSRPAAAAAAATRHPVQGRQGLGQEAAEMRRAEAGHARRRQHLRGRPRSGHGRPLRRGDHRARAGRRQDRSAHPQLSRLFAPQVGPHPGRPRLLQEALRINPDYTLVREYLGEAYLQLGDVARRPRTSSARSRSAAARAARNTASCRNSWPRSHKI